MAPWLTASPQRCDAGIHPQVISSFVFYDNRRLKTNKTRNSKGYAVFCTGTGKINTHRPRARITATSNFQFRWPNGALETKSLQRRWFVAWLLSIQKDLKWLDRFFRIVMNCAGQGGQLLVSRWYWLLIRSPVIENDMKASKWE